jgi:hypothetical protein
MGAGDELKRGLHVPRTAHALPGARPWNVLHRPAPLLRLDGDDVDDANRPRKLGAGNLVRRLVLAKMPSSEMRVADPPRGPGSPAQRSPRYTIPKRVYLNGSRQRNMPGFLLVSIGNMPVL